MLNGTEAQTFTTHSPSWRVPVKAGGGAAMGQSLESTGTPALSTSWTHTSSAWNWGVDASATVWVRTVSAQASSFTAVAPRRDPARTASVAAMVS